MKSIDIKYQHHLKDLGLYEGKIDGLIGPMTQRAIMMFQRMNGLTPDGVIGKMTREEFEDELSSIPGRSEGEVEDDYYTPYSAWPKENTDSLTRFYGQVGTNQVRIGVPYKMVLAWDTDKAVTSIMCNKKVSESLYTILENVKKEYDQQEIERNGFNLFGGCLNVRKIRGGNRWSTHAWGIAVDFDPARNRLRWGKDRAHFARPECKKFLECFRREGWYSLGVEKDYDWMHFQAAYR